VNVSDLKVVGNWIDAADGPEIMGQNSTVKSLYLHVNDDSIKVAVNGIKISDVTVLQGDVGGVVDLGSYGDNRGSISDAVVDGVYVHRITHTTGYDPYNGLVTTRLCPQKPLCDNCDDPLSANLENATVQNLTVNKVGDINTVQRPAAIGVLASYTVSDQSEYKLNGVPGFCSRPLSGGYADSVTINNIQLLNWDVYVAPSEASKLYNNAPASDGSITYNWGTNSDPTVPAQSSVAFFDGKINGLQPENAVRLYKADDSGWYAACGEVVKGSCYDSEGTYPATNKTWSVNTSDHNQPPVTNFNYLFPYKP
jgi:hypothetical protein